MKNTNNLNLSTLNNGAIQEQFDIEMVRVLKNIHDLNTEPNKKRTVTITLEYTTNDDRDVIIMNSTIKSKLVPQIPTSTTLLTGKDVVTGKIEANELKSGIKNQSYMNVDTGEILTDTGEPIKVEETPGIAKIIDLQANRARA